MPTSIDRATVERLVSDGAQLLEVLPEEEFEQEHLAGAIHVPLKLLIAEEAAARLDRGRSVLVYCWDAL